MKMKKLERVDAEIKNFGLENFVDVLTFLSW